MTRGPLTRERLAEILAVLLLTMATIVGGLSFGASADQGWAPVIVMPGDRALPPQRVQAPAAKAERPARVAKAAPIESSPARPQAEPVVGPHSADPVAGGPVPVDVAAAGASKGSPQPAAAPQPASAAPAAKAPVTEGTAAQQYCANIADAAADARFAWQKKVLAEAQQEVEKRIAKLDAKIAEYQKWLARRDEFSKKAQASLVSIYSRMRPDAAASQLVKMDEETAAAVLLKLDPRISSIILNEIPAAQAARLTGTISGAARTTTDKKKS